MPIVSSNRPKGTSRDIQFVLCNTCGTNRNVADDSTSAEYICSTCITHKQDVIDNEELSEQEVLSEYVQNLIKEEETYRIKGDR